MGEPVTDATVHPSVNGAAGASADGSGSSPDSAPPDTPATESRGSLLARLPGTLVRVVSWAVLVVCGLLLVAFVLVPRLTGSTPYTVLTGSMRPSMPPGTTVVVKPVDFGDIAVGDVITYQISSGEPEVVTHRVIGVNVSGEGVRLETQGDANPAPDPGLVREEQIRGKVWYWLPIIGYFSNGVTNDTRTWLAQGLGVALIGYALVTFVVAVIRRKKSAPDEAVGSKVEPTGEAEPESAVASEGESTGEGVRESAAAAAAAPAPATSSAVAAKGITGAPVISAGEAPTRRSLRRARTEEPVQGE